MRISPDYTGTVLPNGYKVIRRNGEVKNGNYMITAWDIKCPTCDNIRAVAMHHAKKLNKPCC